MLTQLHSFVILKKKKKKKTKLKKKNKTKQINYFVRLHTVVLVRSIIQHGGGHGREQIKYALLERELVFHLLC